MSVQAQNSQRSSISVPPGQCRVFSQALRKDGALTWEVPPELEEDGLVPSVMNSQSPVNYNHVFQGNRYALDRACYEHLEAVSEQLLAGEGVLERSVWRPIVMNLARQAALAISPQAATEEDMLDPRKHIKIEVVNDVGTPSDSFVIEGVVIRKNVAHKKMRSQISKPKVLLLAGALEWESNSLAQLDDVIQKEIEFLDSAVSSIASCNPDVVVVERNVARQALEAIQEKGMTLVYNVPDTDLCALALNMNAQIVQSVSDINAKCLGTCEDFTVTALKGPPKVSSRTRVTKLPPLMEFKGCPKDLACTVVLKGDTVEQLNAVRNVVQFAVLTAYHLRLEVACLLDQMSVSATALAATTKEFPVEADVELWKRLSLGIIKNSVTSAAAWRGGRPISSVSPHVAGWTADDARQPVNQPKEYIIPNYNKKLEYSPRPQNPDQQPAVDDRCLSVLHYVPVSVGEAVDTNSNVTDESTGSSKRNLRTEPGSGKHARSSSKDLRGGVGVGGGLDQSTELKYGEEFPPSAFQAAQGPLTPFEFPKMTQVAPDDPSLAGRLSGGTAFDPQQSSVDLEQMESWRSREQTEVGEASTSARRFEEKLEMYQSQKFTANFANRNHRRGLLCEPPQVQSIDFYGEKDSSLAQFLMSIAADANRRCPHGCNAGNSSHVRTFLHGGMRLTVSVVSLPCDKELPGERLLWFWARPKGVCEEPLPSVRRILLSEDAKCISLGQFLELSSNTHFLEVFGRQLHLEFVRYFGYGRTVACIYQDRIRPNTVELPKLQLPYSLKLQLGWMHDAGSELIEEANKAYEGIEQAVTPDSSPTPAPDPPNPQQTSREQFVKASLVPQISWERSQLQDKVMRVMCRADFIDDSARYREKPVTSDRILESLLEFNVIRRQLAVNTLTWTATLQDPSTYASPVFVQEKGKNTNDAPVETRVLGTEGSATPGELDTIPTARDNGGAASRSDKLLADPARLRDNANGGFSRGAFTASSRLSESGSYTSLGLNLQGEGSREQFFYDGSDEGDRTDEAEPRGALRTPFAALIDRPFSPVGERDPWGGDDEGSVEDRDRESSDRQTDVPEVPAHGRLERLPAIPVSGPVNLSRTSRSSLRGLRRNSSVSNLFDIMDREARDFLDARETESDLASSSPGDEPRHRRCASDPFSPRENTLLSQLGERLRSTGEHDDYNDAKLTKMELQNDPGRKDAFGFPDAGANSIPGLAPGHTVQLKPGTELAVNLNGRSLITPGCDSIVIPIFESEPASIIAHVLASISYQKALQQSSDTVLTPSSSKVERGGAESGPPSRQNSDSSVFKDVGGPSGRYKNQVHIVQRFEDDPPGMPWLQAKFEAVSYFARRFGKLRKRCIEGGEQSFIMSLSRCKRWKARGGKSGAYFAKTQDDRYIIKSLSKTEKASFLERLALPYFQYISEAVEEDRQVTLAKILGIFQVSMKSKAEEWVLDVMVMENVLYDCSVCRIYDLKGSKRSRFSSEAEDNPTDKGAVYLDSNLRKHNLSAPPLLVDEKSLKMLETALSRDAKFLCEQSVMDYSLLVGLDKDHSRLVVAIIDFIRQYTWDKRLETWVKSSGIMGEGSEEPTIISPDSYMKRFVSTITSYYHVVPTDDDGYQDSEVN